MAIAYDAVSDSTFQTAQSTYSWTHTCTGSNRFLAVDVALLSVAGTSVSGITCDGVPLIFIGARSTLTGSGRIECWGLAAPATGAKTIAVTLTASIASAGLAVSYTGVNQSTPTESFNSAQTKTVDITTTTDNDWVHAAEATSNTSITAGQTARTNVSGFGFGSGASEDNNGPKTPAGAVTMNYTDMGLTDVYVMGGYGIVPVGAAPAGPIGKANIIRLVDVY